MTVLPGAGGSGTLCGSAVGTQAPIDDLGLVDRDAVVVRGRQAGSGADGTIDIGDDTARAAHHVVVVVPGPRLVTSHGARRLDAPHQSGCVQCPQHVVHGLVGHLAEIVAHDSDDRV